MGNGMIGTIRAGGALAIPCIAALVIAAPAAAQQSRYSSGGWSNPSAPAQPAPRSDRSVDRLVKKLNKLIDEAEAARAADPRFLADLRALTRRHAWPWRKRIVSDDFSDGDYLRNPAWRATGGGFHVSSYGGLRTRFVTTAATVSREDEQQDVRGALLGSILDQMTRRDRQTASPAPRVHGPSRLTLAATIPNAFAVEFSIATTARRGGRIEFGVTQSRQLHGYRIAYNPGSSQPIELLRLGSRGVAVLETVRRPLELADGKLHTIQMTRDRAGEMTVRVDGRAVIRIVDQAFRSRFEGVVMVNKGGDYTIRSISVDGAG